MSSRRGSRGEGHRRPPSGSASREPEQRGHRGELPGPEQERPPQPFGFLIAQIGADALNLGSQRGLAPQHVDTQLRGLLDEAALESVDRSHQDRVSHISLRLLEEVRELQRRFEAEPRRQCFGNRASVHVMTFLDSASTTMPSSSAVLQGVVAVCPIARGVPAPVPEKCAESRRMSQHAIAEIAIAVRAGWRNLRGRAAAREDDRGLP